jgi:magnesium transporter
MNFEFMPELGWRWGYPAVWTLNVVIALGLIFYFRSKDWL